MSEQELNSAAVPLADSVQPQQAVSAGAMLRQLRESAGVDVGMLASALKVSQTKLLALEADQYHELPDLAFARGLAASICRAFGVDAAAVLTLMPVASSELNPLKNALNAPLKRSSKGLLANWAKSVPRSLLLVVGLLLLGSAVLWLWPTLPIRLESEGQAVLESGESPVLPVDGLVPGLQTSPTGLVDEEPATDAEGDSETVPGPALDGEETSGLASDTAVPWADSPTAFGKLPLTGATAPVDRPPSQPGLGAVQVELESTQPEAVRTEPVAVAAPVEKPEAAPEPLTAAIEEGGLLSLTASAESWVSVQDANGRSVLNRLLNAGDQVRVEGVLPLSVVIGRKDAVRVSVRGQAFDHLNLSRSSVARFQVE